MTDTTDAELDALAHQAENPNTDPEFLRTLEKHPHARVRAALARNPSTPFSVLLLLENDGHKLVRMSLATNPEFRFVPDAILDQHTDVQRVIARMPHSNRETLDVLAQIPEMALLVALNTGASSETLHTLSSLNQRDPDVDVIRLHTRLIQNPSTPGKTLDEILDRYERADGAGYPEAFLPVLLGHPAVTPFHLRRYSTEADPHPNPAVSQDIRRAIYANPACPVDLLVRAIGSPWSMVAMGEATENSSTPSRMVKASTEV